MRLIATASTLPRSRRPTAAVPSSARTDEPQATRDHALGLHRFLGVLQIFGGLTLVAAYSLGEAALFDGAPAILIAIGLLQMLVGASWLARTRALRDWIVGRPGGFVLLTLTASCAVMVLGGSDSSVVFVTSAMAWLVASGYALLGYRWLVTSVLVTAGVSAVWVIVGGNSGGYSGDGDYGTAIFGLAAAVVPGLWLGRVTGETFTTLNRWHLVELHERGLIGRLRAALQRVDASAAAVADQLPAGSAAPELSALRARLGLGAILRSDAGSVRLDTVAAEIEREYEGAGLRAELHVVLAAPVASLELGTAIADTLTEVIRRQLLNVARHAPDASVATVTIDADAEMLRARIEDDGAGEVPFRAGTGTEWSVQQLARVGGTSRYYAGDQGVGFEVRVPVAATASISQVPELSVIQTVQRFAGGMLGAMRFAGYTVDSLAAYIVRDQIGALWLLMPIASVVIEVVIRGGIPGLGARRAPPRNDGSPRVGWPLDLRVLVASILTVGVAAAYSVPTGSPAEFVPATSSVVILAHLLYVQRGVWWGGLELLRVAAVTPLLLRHGAGGFEVLIVYPAGFSLLVYAMLRFGDRAMALEATAADAMGRAALAGAAVRGIALHHDAVDVIVRAGADAPQLREAVRDLELALDDLAAVSSDTLDAREATLTGLQAAVPEPVVDRSAPSGLNPNAAVSLLTGAVDRVGLIELAALAADERASCSPPGLFGRRRLRTFELAWSGAATRRAELTIAAHPSLGPPDPRAVERLRAVAGTLGVTVASSPESLTLTFRR